MRAKCQNLRHAHDYVAREMARHSKRTASAAVMENPDLVGSILAHADLAPKDLVAAGQVSKAWRVATHTNASLLLAAAHRPKVLTKGTFCGLFALEPREAAEYPHVVVPRTQGGIMCMYRSSAIDAVLPRTGGLEGWRQRLAQRAVHQASLERAFGPDWCALSGAHWWRK